MNALTKSMRVLLIIDLQNDFCTNGSLEVPEAESIIPGINKAARLFDYVLATQDWHPPEHVSFSANHPGTKPFDSVTLNGQPQVLWPVHCVFGSHGAELHKDLDSRPINYIFRKGYRPSVDSYSAYFDNCKLESTLLQNLFTPVDQFDIYVCGLALDYCVGATARDAKMLGYNVFVVEDLCKSIGPKAMALKELESHGINVISSENL